MDMVPDIATEIEALYAELPRVLCEGCGECCVSPSCTLAEFVYLMAGVAQHLSRNDLEKFLTASPVLHPEYEGNLRCGFLTDRRCSVHEVRTGACRLFGVPALAKLDIPELVECRKGVDARGPQTDAAFIRDWLGRLHQLNKQLYPLDAEPYFLTGLTVECWLDIYFDTTFTDPFFEPIRTIMADNIPLSDFFTIYRPRTGIRDKLDKIAAFSNMIDLGDASLLRPLLVSIRDDYPLTGTYFYEEANMYLKALDAGPPTQG